MVALTGIGQGLKGIVHVRQLSNAAFEFCHMIQSDLFHLPAGMAVLPETDQ